MALLTYVKPALDLAVTAGLWTYYILCYVLLFGPLYVAALLVCTDRERAFQQLNSLLYRSFFSLLHAIVPGLQIIIDPEVRAIRSSVVIANHLSFLDSILFVALFEKHTTIVKQKFFKIPIFGWVLRHAGYITPSEGGVFTETMPAHIARLEKHLAGGGNFFVFPEGTRSRTGSLGPFEKGAFSIARLCKAPIRVVKIINTDKLYPPDRFLFQTCRPNVITVRLVGTISPAYTEGSVAVSELMRQAAALLLIERQGCDESAAWQQ